MSGWIKCSERMPEEHETVLLWGERALEPLNGHWGDWCGTKERWVYFDGVGLAWGYPNLFTHWMPLPEPPKD